MSYPGTGYNKRLLYYSNKLDTRGSDPWINWKYNGKSVKLGDRKNNVRDGLINNREEDSLLDKSTP